MQKMNVVKNFCSIYQSIFVIISSEVRINLKKEMIKGFVLIVASIAFAIINN
jgi:hypothetical protein